MAEVDIPTAAVWMGGGGVVEAVRGEPSTENEVQVAIGWCPTLACEVAPVYLLADGKALFTCDCGGSTVELQRGYGGSLRMDVDVLDPKVRAALTGPDGAEKPGR